MSLIKIGTLNFPADESSLKLFKQIQLDLGLKKELLGPSNDFSRESCCNCGMTSDDFTMKMRGDEIENR